jgi:putative flippase GtrA
MILNKKPVRFIIAGIFNTVFGYLVGVFLYKILNSIINIFLIGLLSNIISISFSFLNYKIFVFKTKDMWLSEYLKCYLVYGFTMALGIFNLWFFVEELKINIWVSQGIIVMISPIISYFGHNKFTFKGK